ncbi:MAG: hypothetical protein Q8P84_03185 [Deltaproteobacteria bacterium]|nr:hypothetical protein [Deltaproteobacteria bacterium]
MSELKMYQATAIKGELRLFDKANPALQQQATVVTELAIDKSRQQDTFTDLNTLFAKYANDNKNQVAVFFPIKSQQLLGYVYVYEVPLASDGIKAGGVYLFDKAAGFSSPFLPSDASKNPEGYAVGMVKYVDFDGTNVSGQSRVTTELEVREQVFQAAMAKFIAYQNKGRVVVETK